MASLPQPVKKCSAMHADKSPKLREVAPILRIQSTSLRTRKTVVEICDIVAERGARLVAAGIVGILKKIGRDSIAKARNHFTAKGKRTVVAVDGGLYKHYPKFRENLQNAVVELIGKEAADYVDLQLSKDGSGIGAALLAASHSSVNEESRE